MATYAFDYYGSSKYGSRQFVDFGVDPMVATVLAYDSVQITWNKPGGLWTSMRVLRSRSGYAVTEKDGTLLLEQRPESAVEKFVDTVTGGWNYYSIFLLNSGRWERAATVSVLVPFDYESSERLISMVPEYYRLVRDNAAGFSVRQYEMNPRIYLSSTDTLENDQFTQFMNVFGWGFDIVRSHIDTTMDGYNPDTIHLNRLALLADQLGSPLETSVPAHKNRSLVRNLALIYRKKGTLSGIREAMSLATGWTVDVYGGENLLLNVDQSEFDNPKVLNWNANTRYVTNDYVLYGLWYFRAKSTAYGAAQAPPLTQTSNTWWDAATFANVYRDSSQTRPDTGDVGTWQAYNPVSGSALPGRTAIGMGMKHPTDPQAVSTNALSFYNDTGSTIDVVARSIPLAANLPGAPSDPTNLNLVIGSGIPMPRVTKVYRATATYGRGARVRYQGSPYEALTAVTGVLPSDTTKWKRLGTDNRVRLNVSYYAHGPFTGANGSGALQTYPYVSAYDERGVPITEVTCTPNAAAGVFYGALLEPGIVNETRTGWSATNAGSGFQVKNSGDSGYVYATSAGRGFRAATGVGVVSGVVSVVLSRVGTREYGVMFRYVSNNNYWFATQTRLVNRVSSTNETTVATWPSLVSGDRLLVKLDGNNITVYKNSLTSVPLASTSSTSGNTSQIHGLFAEAVT